MQGSSSSASCKQIGSLFGIFQNKMQDPGLPRERGNAYEDILLAPDLPLDQYAQQIRNSASQLLPGDFGRFLANQLTGSFEYLSRLRQLIESLTAGQLRILVNEWHRHFDEALSNPKSQDKYVLCAFSTVQDFTLTLDQAELNGFISAVAQYQPMPSVLSEAQTRADGGTNGRGTKLDEEVWDEIDLLAAVIALMKRAGLKPAVRDPKLQDWLIDYVGRQKATKKTFGGAAGNESFILRELGFQVLVHTPYHHDQQAQLAPNCAKRLIFGRQGPIQPFPSLQQGDPDVACRFSVVLQLIPNQGPQGQIIGPSLRMPNGAALVPRQADRVIPVIPYPRTNHPANWNELRVTWQNQRSVTITRQSLLNNLKGFTNHDWPYLPVFQHPHDLNSNPGILHIELATAAEMQQIASQVQAVLLGNIQALGKTTLYGSSPLRNLVRDALVEQLKALSPQGANLYLELSGVSSEQELTTLSTDVLNHAGIKNIGLNREELAQITSEFGSRYYAGPRPIVPEAPYAIYCRAHKLLTELDLHSLYVHDPDLDMLLVRVSESDEEKSNAQLDRYRQAMLLAKAAVPEALFGRGNVSSKWPLVLSTKSLVSIMDFADDYLSKILKLPKNQNPQNKKQWGQKFNNFLQEGYDIGPDGIAVVVAPTIAVDLPPEITLAGAGDMCFAAFVASL